MLVAQLSLWESGEGPYLRQPSLFLNPTFQVSGLSHKNYRSSASELRSLVKTFGFELERHLFRCLLAKVCKNVLFNITSTKV